MFLYMPIFDRKCLGSERLITEMNIPSLVILEPFLSQPLQYNLVHLKSQIVLTIYISQITYQTHI